MGAKANHYQPHGLLNAITVFLRVAKVHRVILFGFGDFGTLPSDLPDFEEDEFFDVSPILPPPGDDPTR